MKRINIIFVLISFLFITACGANQAVKTQTSVKTESAFEGGAAVKRESAAKIDCTTPRPEMCTREYRPVCAQKFNGIQCKKAPCPDTDQVTFSNACEACADIKVQSFQLGACTL